MAQFLPMLNSENTGQPSKNNVIRLFVALGVLSVIISTLILLFGQGSKELDAVQAQIEDQMLDLHAPMSGMIRSVSVCEGQELTRGQIVLEYENSHLHQVYLSAQIAYQAALLGNDPDLPDTNQRNQAQEEIKEEIQGLRQIEQVTQQEIEDLSIVQARALLALRTPGISTEEQASATQYEINSSISLAQARQQHENAVYNRQQAEKRLQSLQQMNINNSSLDLSQYWLARLHLTEQTLAATSLQAPEDGLVVRLDVQPGSQTIYGDVVLSYMPKDLLQEN